MKNLFTYEVKVKFTIDVDYEKQRSSPVDTRVLLTTPQNVGWKDERGLPNAKGLNAMTNALIHALASQVRAADLVAGVNAEDHEIFVLDELMKVLKLTAGWKLKETNYSKTDDVDEPKT